MRRRQVLAAAAALLPTALAGCSGRSLSGSAGVAYAPSAALRMTAMDDPAIARKALYSFENPDSERRAVVADVAGNGSATVEARAGDPPLPAGEPIVYGDGVYRLSHEVTGTRPMRAFSVTIDPVREDDPEPKASETVAFEDLPAVDRAQFERLGFVEERPFGIGTGFDYAADEVERSALVPEPERPVVVWPNGPARFAVGDSWAYDLATYRYTGERLSSAGAYGADLRERHAFDLSGLSAAERDIVRTAVDADEGDGYAVPHDEQPPAAFGTLADRFRGHDRVRGDAENGSGIYLVRYDGAVHWTRLTVSDDPSSTGTVGGEETESVGAEERGTSAGTPTGSAVDAARPPRSG